MILEKIYKDAIQKKKEEIFKRYNNEKKMVAKGKLSVFQKKFQEKINKEYAQLFSQNTDEKSEYHFIETFSTKMPGIEDSYLTFDEDFFNTKDFIKDRYKDHGYGPKVDIFFSECDEVIVRKLGELQAYQNLRSNLEQELKNFEKNKNECASNVHEETDQMNDLQKSTQLEGHTTTTEQPHVLKLENEKIFTSIRQIADFFNCSLPTAQKIKNSIPKNQYIQKERTFAIQESVLLKNFGGNTNNR